MSRRWDRAVSAWCTIPPTRAAKARPPKIAGTMSLIGSPRSWSSPAPLRPTRVDRVGEAKISLMFIAFTGEYLPPACHDLVAGRFQGTTEADTLRLALSL